MHILMQGHKTTTGSLVACVFHAPITELDSPACTFPCFAESALIDFALIKFTKRVVRARDSPSRSA